MTKKEKSISAVNELIRKLENKEYMDIENFKSISESYLLEFLGPDSPIYLRVNKFSFSVLIISNMDKAKRQSLFQNKIMEFKELLNNSTEFISIHDIYKKPKKNWFSEYDNWKIAVILFSFLGFGFGIGKWTEEFEVFKSKVKSENSISHATPKTMSKTNKITDN